MRSEICENASRYSTHTSKLSSCWSWLLRNCIKFLIISCNLYLKQLFADHLQGEFKETALCGRGKRDRLPVCVHIYIFIYIYISYKNILSFWGHADISLICFSVRVFGLNFDDSYKLSRVGCMVVPCLGRECSGALAEPCSYEEWTIILISLACHFLPIFFLYFHLRFYVRSQCWRIGNRPERPGLYDLLVQQWISLTKPLSDICLSNFVLKHF